MTEADWFACTRTVPMLAFLSGKASARKLRLFGCGNFRRIWLQTADPRARAAVEVAELFSDGILNSGRLAQAKRAVGRAARRAIFATRAAAALTEEDQPKTPNGLAGRRLCIAVRSACSYIRSVAGPNHTGIQLMEKRLTYEDGLQAELLRDLFGNPFRPVSMNPAWLTADVRNLAQAAYDERLMPTGELDPTRLMVLADALEEVGTADELVAHLRGKGPHVRGCCVLDYCLGRS